MQMFDNYCNICNIKELMLFVFFVLFFHEFIRIGTMWQDLLAGVGSKGAL